jgi:hypothetical protein
MVSRSSIKDEIASYKSQKSSHKTVIFVDNQSIFDEYSSIQSSIHFKYRAHLGSVQLNLG